MRVVIDNLNINPAERNIMITHQFVTGAERTESEEISVGGTDNVDVSVFDGFDYTALGHIHRPQNCTTERVRYSGTPLKYSFSEAKDEKSVTVVELGEKDSIKVSEIPLIPMRDMVEIKGKYEEIMLRDYYKNTTYQEDYVHITLTDEEEIVDAVLDGKPCFFDVYRSTAIAAVSILGWRSVLNKSKRYDIPDFRKERDKKKWENDDLTPFPKAGAPNTLPFNSRDKI